MPVQNIILLGLIAGIMLVVMSLVLLLAMVVHRSRTKQWQTFANTHHLTMHSQLTQGTTLTGEIQGRQVRITRASERRGRGQSRSYIHVHAMLGLPESLRYFSLETHSMRHQVVALLGDEDPGIPVGDPKLDDTFILKTSNPEGVLLILRQPQVKDALMALCALHLRGTTLPTNKFAQEIIARTRADLPELEVTRTHIDFKFSAQHTKPAEQILYIEDIVQHTTLLERAILKHLQMV